MNSVMTKQNFFHKKAWIKRLLIIVGSCLLLFGLTRIYFCLTDDFRLANMTYDLPHRPEWEVENLGEEDRQLLQKILQQKFSYMSKGAQSYAFGSEDQRYVLKFFKFKHLKPHWIVELFPSIPPFSSYREKQTRRKWNKLEGVFSGYRLAYEVHRKESGLIFIHLNKTHHLYPPIHVIDKLGFNRTIHLDDVVFIIQDKAVITRTVMQTLLQQNDLRTAKKRIKQIFDLYLSEYHKGIVDHDHGVMHNIGFVGENPIHLDVGNLKADEWIKQPEFYESDLVKIAVKLATYIQSNFPEHYSEMGRAIEALVTERLGTPFFLQGHLAIACEIC